MIRVFCLDDCSEYWFNADNGFDAIGKMLYTLNLSCTDKRAKINLHNDRTWELIHNGKTYACLH